MSYCGTGQEHGITHGAVISDISSVFPVGGVLMASAEHLQIVWTQIADDINMDPN